MNTYTINKINDKLKVMSDNDADDIMSYLDFLSSNKSIEDWFTQLNKSEIELIKQGQEDLTNNKIYTHHSAQEIIQNFIKSKV
jgi:hypothetical protein